MLKDYLFSDFKIKQSSVFNMSDIYRLLWNWFDMKGYNFLEKEYNDIDEAGGKHLEIFWVAEKTVDAYVKFVIETNFLILGMKDVDIEKGGLKLKTQKGAFEIRISSYLLKDYDNKWSRGAFGKLLQNIYDKHLIRKRIDKYEAEIVDDTHELLDEIRAFIDVHKY